MADQQNILNWLQNPDLLDDAGARELKLLLEGQAYFQPYYFLLLRYYKKYNNWEYEKLLKKSVLNIFDRRRLFVFLNDSISLENFNTPVIEESKEPDVPKTEQSPLIVRSISETISDDLAPQLREDKDTLGEALSDAIQQQVIGNSQVQEKSILPDVSTFELDENFEIVRPNNSEDIVFTSINENRDVEEILLIEEDSSVQNEQSDEDLYLKTAKIEGVILDMHEELPDDAAIFGETQSKELEAEGVSISEGLAFNSWLDQLEATSSEQKEENIEPLSKNGAFDLIDKFLQEDPRIKPKPVADEERQDISESSVEEHEDFITDTLAKIYLKQGHYTKAILAYEKLSLKFPEKSTYFASQIDEINKLINNQ